MYVLKKTFRNYLEKKLEGKSLQRALQTLNAPKQDTSVGVSIGIGIYFEMCIGNCSFHFKTDSKLVLFVSAEVEDDRRKMVWIAANSNYLLTRIPREWGQQEKFTTSEW